MTKADLPNSQDSEVGRHNTWKVCAVDQVVQQTILLARHSVKNIIHSNDFLPNEVVELKDVLYSCEFVTMVSIGVTINLVWQLGCHCWM